MMNYLAALLGIALLGAITTASLYRADALDYKAQLTSLKASYSQAASDAKADAAKQEQKDLEALRLSSSQALQQATSSANQAQLTAASYQKKLAEIAKSKPADLPHICANVEIPEELAK